MNLGVAMEAKIDGMEVTQYFLMNDDEDDE